VSGDGKAPSVDEQSWLRLISMLTCGVCWRISDGHRIPGWDTPCQERHHMLDAGRRVGHACTLPTCRLHHQTKGGPAAWERQFGFTELDVMNDTIGRVMDLIRRGARP
jgi:hypothetical protein